MLTQRKDCVLDNMCFKLMCIFDSVVYDRVRHSYLLYA